MTHTKRPTRFKAEVVNGNDDDVWEVLVHDFPSTNIRSAFARAGLTIRRASVPRNGPLSLNYSDLDPAASVEAAREHAARRETQLGNALMLLIDRAGEWVSREDIRRAAGDSGDRRVRELRDRNWPVEISQRVEGAAWHVRLVLPVNDDNLGLF